MGPKTIPETRSGRAFGIPMIYLNVALILMRCDPERKDVYAARATQCVEEIFKYFVKFDLGCTLENVAPDGTPRFAFTDGRIVNPGHDIEGVWFLLEYAKQFGKPELIERRRPSSTTPSTPVGTRNTADFCTLSMPRVCRPRRMSTI